MPSSRVPSARRALRTAAAATAAAVTAACGSGDATAPAGSGALRVQATNEAPGITAERAPASGAALYAVSAADARFPYDSVARVDLFVVRVDAKREEADSAEAERRTGDDDKGADGWVTLAEPKAKVELSALRNGATQALGITTVPAGTYRGLRLVIDPAQSSVTLRSGTTLSARVPGDRTPGVEFPSAGRSGIKVQLLTPVVVAAGAATPPALVIDFNLSGSFQMKGSSVGRDGLRFRPTIKATVR